MVTNFYHYDLVLWHTKCHFLVRIIYFIRILISFLIIWLFVTPQRALTLKNEGPWSVWIHLLNILFCPQWKSRNMMCSRVSREPFTSFRTVLWHPLASPSSPKEIVPIPLWKWAEVSTGNFIIPQKSKWDVCFGKNQVDLLWWWVQ